MWMIPAATSMPSMVRVIMLRCVFLHPLGPGDAAPLSSAMARATTLRVTLTALCFRMSTPAHAAAAAWVSAGEASTAASAKSASATR